MIPEAEVFVLADQAAVQVYGRIREDQWDSMLPPLFEMPGADQPVPLRQAINHYAYDNSWVPDMLAGRTMDEVGASASMGICSAAIHAATSNASVLQPVTPHVRSPIAMPSCTVPMATSRPGTTSGSSTSHGPSAPTMSHNSSGPRIPSLRSWHAACGRERRPPRRCGVRWESSVRPCQSPLTHRGAIGSSLSPGASPEK